MYPCQVQVLGAQGLEIALGEGRGSCKHARGPWSPRCFIIDTDVDVQPARREPASRSRTPSPRPGGMEWGRGTPRRPRARAGAGPQA